MMMMAVWHVIPRVRDVNKPDGIRYGRDDVLILVIVVVIDVTLISTVIPNVGHRNLFRVADVRLTHDGNSSGTCSVERLRVSARGATFSYDLDLARSLVDLGRPDVGFVKYSLPTAKEFFEVLVIHDEPPASKRRSLFFDRVDRHAGHRGRRIQGVNTLNFAANAQICYERASENANHDVGEENDDIGGTEEERPIVELFVIKTEDKEEADNAAHTAPPEDNLEFEGDFVFTEDVENVDEDKDRGKTGDENGADDNDDENDVPATFAEIAGEKKDTERHENEDLRNKVEETGDLEERLAGVDRDGIPAIMTHDNGAYKEGNYTRELKELCKFVGEVGQNQNLSHLIR